MSSKSAYALAWLATTAVAATVAWRSLGFVDADIDTDRSQAAAVVGTATSSTSIPSSTSSGAAPSTPTSITDASSTTTSTPPSPGVVEQVVELVGGTAAVSFSPNSIQVLWATPAPGFRVETHTEGLLLEVEFKGEDHESKLTAWWDGGARYSTAEDRDED